MKKIVKVFLGTVLLLIAIGTREARATELSTTSEATYDLIEGGRQSFLLETEEGLAEVEISEVQNDSFGSPRLRAIKSGTYNVSYTSPSAWRANYRVSISNARITGAHSASASAITGSITSKRLSVTSSTEARYFITWKKQAIYINCGVRSAISGNSLRVSGF